MSDEYTIITYIRGKRFYWRKHERSPRSSSSTKANSGGSWGVFPDATIFSADERAKYPLPHEGAWVSVLHGMGSSKYAADSELNSRS